MKILVVDDELVSRAKMNKILEGMGQCTAVDNGKAALVTFKNAIASGKPFNLITLDISMPDMDGTEVLFEIRQFESEMEVPKFKQTKILMVTSHSDKESIMTCVQAGCNDYIVKPFNKETIISKIKSLGITL